MKKTASKKHEQQLKVKVSKVRELQSSMLESVNGGVGCQWSCRSSTAFN